MTNYSYEMFMFGKVAQNCNEYPGSFLGTLILDLIGMCWIYQSSDLAYPI